MKTRIVTLCIFLIIMAFTAVEIYGENENFYIPKSNEEIYGTWINEDMITQKLIYYYWGYAEIYREVSQETPTYKFTFTIVEKWSDSKGNVWYKTFNRGNAAIGIEFWITKISNTGTVYESVSNVGEFPTKDELNIDNFNYVIYYRQ
ncbi:MAG: hypothetical protein V3V74_05410 [Nitrosomonadaceae bacterium]